MIQLTRGELHVRGNQTDRDAASVLESPGPDASIANQPRSHGTAAFVSTLVLSSSFSGARFECQ